MASAMGIERTLRLALQFGKFGIVGVLATAVHFSVVIALVEWSGMPPLPANVLAYGTAFPATISPGWRHPCSACPSWSSR